MYYNKNFPDSIFKRGHRTLTLGTVLMGSVLLLLAVLIFAYPALIAYFIAAVILFAGLSALAIGWKLWRIRNEISKLDRVYDESHDSRSPWSGRSHFTYIRW
ncbi:MAG: hypothetical protein VW455_13505 [Nitrospinota bacterium]